MTRSWLWFVLTVVLVEGRPEDDFQVECKSRSVHVMWKVTESMKHNPARLFLGSCIPSKFVNVTDGAEVHFNSSFSECGFKRRATWKFLIFENDVTYRPLPKPNPPSFSQVVRCVFDRPKDWTQNLHSPAAGVIQGYGELDFHMTILNSDFSGPAESTVFPLGSFIPIWAGVNQQAHQPLVLLLDECVASTSGDLAPDTPTYPLINNHGCLVDGKTSLSSFLPRYHSSSILLHLQTFRFAVGQEVYIHCKLVAWDPDNLSEKKKACHYNKATREWELLDNPFQNALCECCDSQCKGREKRDEDSAPQGLVLNSVLGPVKITADLA